MKYLFVFKMATKSSKPLALLQELFFQSVENFPDQIATIFSGNDVQSISYYDLGQTVKNLSTFFKNVFLNNEVVAIYSVQNLHLPTVLLAILNSSAAFYPMSTSFPPQIILNNLERHSIHYVLVDNTLVEGFIKQQNKEKSISTEDNARLELIVPENQEVCELFNKIQITLMKMLHSKKNVVEWKERLAYVMQTSGTTGEPKAVFVPHSCILPNITEFSSIFEVTHQDIVFLASPYTFDPFVVQMFLALSNGGSLLIVPESDKLLPTSLCSKLFGQHKVSIFQPTPSLLYYIGEDLIRRTILSEKSTLSVLAMGGEPCPLLTTLRKWKHPKCKTRLYNIYGITEVSSWATCYHITDNDLDKTTSDGKLSTLNYSLLGYPLNSTRLVVYNDGGSAINGDGIGNLWIGGDDRKCLLEGECPDSIPSMRDSGDIVEVKNGEMRHLGRSDNQIKRFGCRVNLEYIEKVVLLVDELQSCAVVIQPTSLGGGLIHLFITLNVTRCEKTFKEKLKTHLMQVLPRAAQPDAIHVIFKLPLTNHGKTNKQELLKYLDSHSSQDLDLNIVDALTRMWCDCLQNFHQTDSDRYHKRKLDEANVFAINPPKPQDMFVLQGGDSFLAVRLADAIERWARERYGTFFDPSSLVELVINRTFEELVRYVKNSARGSSDIHDPYVGQSTISRTSKTIPKKILFSSPKKLKKDNISSGIRKDEEESVNPEGRVTDTMIQTNYKQCCNVSKTGAQGRVLCLQCQDRLQCPVFSPISIFTESLNDKMSDWFDITVTWKASLRKCIDASPLVVVSSCCLAHGEVFIGSHSHLFMAVSLSTGDLKWKVCLGGRVESSSCLSLCAQLIVVGCYDGKVYVLARSDGAVVWTYQTGNAVKSSPCLDHNSGLIWVGSHDGVLYALNVIHRSCQIQVNCLGGSCFNSPAICSQPSRAYIGTLAGRFLSVNAVTGDVMWCKKFNKPIFASPLVYDSNVYVATVDGCLKCLNHDGDCLWECSTVGEIFSSPVLSLQGKGSEIKVIVGSHDHSVYCFTNLGKCEWSSPLDSPIYSTPCVLSCTKRFKDGFSSYILLVITTKGTLYLLDLTGGNVFKKFSFPGEIFSSPSLLGRQVVVGCRDDFLYCLNLF